MAAPITQTSSATQSWGQAKKLASEPPPTDGGTTSPETAPAEPDGSEPAGTAEPTATVPAVQGASGAPVMASTAAASEVVPMPDRLRDLIAEYSRSDAPRLTELHSLAQRLQDSADSMVQIGLAPDVVQRTTAEIVAQASASIRAQATQTQDGVRALLRLE